LQADKTLTFNNEKQLAGLIDLCQMENAHSGRFQLVTNSRKNDEIRSYLDKIGPIFQ